MIRLSDNQRIDQYTVLYFIKESAYCASYRVMDSVGKSYFMKLFDMSGIPQGLINVNEPQEVTICRSLTHENIITYVDSGSIMLEGEEIAFLVTDFIVGDLLSEAMQSDFLMSAADKIDIVLSIAYALQYMSSKGYVHNDICPRNIVLAHHPFASHFVPQIIDFGHATVVGEASPCFPTHDLNPLYRAPETFAGRYSPASDVYSLSVLLYCLLFGRNPWGLDEDALARDEDVVLTLEKARQARISYESALDIPEAVIGLLKRGLSEYSDERPSYPEFIDALLGKPQPTETSGGEAQPAADPDPTPSEELSFTPVMRQNTSGSQGGFRDVAGMDELKKTLRDKVIWVLSNPSVSKEYRILPPNGMLLYGPPGCGKTFFAQKFAEETGYKYMMVNGSDLGSTLIHGSQLKIRQMFESAAKEAPVVLCFDEFDAFVPVRGAQGAEYQADEVNEFLSQLNNCSERRIFVVGTTNRKDRIDPAVLRKGRLDLQYEIPAPDQAAREAMFRIHLSGRPLADDIDYGKLSELTEGFASADIAYIVNEAALAAAMARELISERHLEGAVRANTSSLVDTRRPKIGF